MASDVSLGGTHLVAWLILRGTCGYCPCLCVHTLVGPCLTDSLCCTCSWGTSARSAPADPSCTAPLPLVWGLVWRVARRFPGPCCS